MGINKPALCFLLILALLAQAVPAIAQETGQGIPAPATPKPRPKAKAQPVRPIIPTKPSSPPSLAVPVPVENFQCQRNFIYRGKILICDSNLQRDGEGLREIIQNVPDAVSELNLYQYNRRKIRTTAYAGTLGLALAVSGWIIGQQFTEPNGSPSATGRLIRNVGVVSGLSIAVGSIVYGFSVLQTNEQHLGNSVLLYNQARPDDPIQLQFSTGITF